MRIATQHHVLSAPPGRHNAGPCLYLIVSGDIFNAPASALNRRWVLRYRKPSTRKPTELGLGKAELVTLKEALDLAFDHRRSIAKGIDPVEHRREQKVTRVTFAEMASAFIAIKQQEWRSESHYATMQFLLQTYASSLATKHISTITPDDVEAAIAGTWQRSRTQGRRTLAAIGQVFELAISKGFCTSNPADWRIMRRRFPKVGRSQHYKAMDFKDVPMFVKRLRHNPAKIAGARNFGRHIPVQPQSGSICPSAIEFLILTACRASEVVGMKWSEVDLVNQLWTIPAERTKTNQEHRVPLSDRAMELLQPAHMRRLRSDYVWPGRRSNTHIGAHVLYVYLTRDMKESVTIHGFRSTFTDWVDEETNFSTTSRKLALGHVPGDRTDIAYKRKDELEKRRLLMQAWADHCSSTLRST